MRFDDWLQTLKARDAGLRIAARRVPNNGSENGHCATVDVDERLRDYKADDLSSVRSDALCFVASTLY